jgi:hypothetical protein
LGWAPRIDLETGIRLAFESARKTLEQSLAGVTR